MHHAVKHTVACEHVHHAMPTCAARPLCRCDAASNRSLHTVRRDISPPPEKSHPQRTDSRISSPLHPGDTFVDPSSRADACVTARGRTAPDDRRTTAERPVIETILLANRQVVDARVTMRHQAVLVELPVFVAVRTEPVAGVVMPFVGKAHRDAIAVERPQLLDQPVVGRASTCAAAARRSRRGRSRIPRGCAIGFAAYRRATRAAGRACSIRPRRRAPSGAPFRA